MASCTRRWLLQQDRTGRHGHKGLQVSGLLRMRRCLALRVQRSGGAKASAAWQAQHLGNGGAGLRGQGLPEAQAVPERVDNKGEGARASQALQQAARVEACSEGQGQGRRPGRQAGGRDVALVGGLLARG